MKNRLTSFGIVALTPMLLLCGCGAQKRVVESELPFAKIYTAAWMQRSAEYEALCYQAFNGARLYLDQALALSQKGDKPLAIITDIDETILDNSPNAVHQGLKGELFDSAEWTKWCTMAVADTVPGAPGFLKYAANEGVEIFYITNRNFNEQEGTLLNLQKYDFPFADNDHLLLKGDTSNKDLRREQVLKDFDVVVYVGDQLTDFPGYNALNEKDVYKRQSSRCPTQRPSAAIRSILIPSTISGALLFLAIQYYIYFWGDCLRYLKRREVVCC